MSSLGSSYAVLRELGRGTSGVVSLVRRKADGRLFAAKEILFTDYDERLQVMREVSLMQSLPQHPSILGLEEVLESRGSVTLILEYSNEGTLRDLIYGPPSIDSTAGGNTTKRQQGLPEDDVVKYLTQLVNAIGFLHTHSVVHRDIKLENLLLFSQKSVVKISDFGVATILGRTATGRERMAQTTTGTPHYMSPEVCEGNPYNYKSDVWSLGVVAYEMCAQSVPFQAANVLALSGKICHQATPDLPMEYSRRLDAIIKTMLTKNQETRPTMSQVSAMLQYFRRKRAENARDGPDIGGFNFDPTILPDLFDDGDLLERQSRGEGGPGDGGQEVSWGLQSNGVGGGDHEDEMDLWRDDSPPAGPPAEQRLPREISSSAANENRRGIDAKPPQRSGISAEAREAIFTEAKKQAISNKTRVESEMRRVSHDDDHLSLPSATGAEKPSTTPRLRSLIEELQEEMRLQTERVESMLNGKPGQRTSSTGEMPSESSHPLRQKFAAADGNRSGATVGRASPPPLLDTTVPTAASPSPFADPAASTPSAVRKVPQPAAADMEPPSRPIFVTNDVLEFSPREGCDPSPKGPPKRTDTATPKTASLTPVQASIAAPAQLQPPASQRYLSTPQRGTGGLTPSTTPRVPKPTGTAAPAKTPPTASLSVAAPAPPVATKKAPIPQLSVAAASPRPPTKSISSSDVHVPDAKHARGSVGGGNAPRGSLGPQSDGYFPPCAHCIRVAKERRQSTVGEGTPIDPSSSSLFVQINPSKLYCSTCHAPFCAACADLVHDPFTMTTNIPIPRTKTQNQPSGGGGSMSNLSMKRHNLFYLALSDPSFQSPSAGVAPLMQVESDSSPPTLSLVNNNSLAQVGSNNFGAASPTNSRRSLVTFHADTLPIEHSGEFRRQKTDNCGCCVVM